MNDKVSCHFSNVVSYMRRHHGANVSYDKAWRGREIALNSIRSTSKFSYALLSSFSTAFIEKNPGTYTTQEFDDEGRFKYYFMTLAAFIDAWNYCFPIMLVDGATLKNKFMGTLLFACTLDGNSQVVPLAFAIIDLENNGSRSWFFHNLKAAFRESNDLVIAFDGHKSIDKGVSVVYDSAEHELCSFHLYKNLKKNQRLSPIENAFHISARAYITMEFEYYMRQLDDLAPSIRHELEDVGKSKWAKAFCGKKRYSLMTTNIFESKNSLLKEVHELPVIGLLESIRSLVQKWFYECRICWSFKCFELILFD